MSAYYFRFMCDDGAPTEYVGLVVAANRTQLFWEIDQYGDPYCCQIKPLQFGCGSICLREKITTYPSGDIGDGFDEIEVDYSEIEFDPPDLKEKGWKYPKWTRDDVCLKNPYHTDSAV